MRNAAQVANDVVCRQDQQQLIRLARSRAACAASAMAGAVLRPGFEDDCARGRSRSRAVVGHRENDAPRSQTTMAAQIQVRRASTVSLASCSAQSAAAAAWDTAHATAAKVVFRRRRKELPAPAWTLRLRIARLNRRLNACRDQWQVIEPYRAKSPGS